MTASRPRRPARRPPLRRRLAGQHRLRHPRQPALPEGDVRGRPPAAGRPGWTTSAGPPSGPGAGDSTRRAFGSVDKGQAEQVAALRRRRPVRRARCRSRSPRWPPPPRPPWPSGAAWPRAVRSRCDAGRNGGEPTRDSAGTPGACRACRRRRSAGESRTASRQEAWARRSFGPPTAAGRPAPGVVRLLPPASLADLGHPARRTAKGRVLAAARQICSTGAWRSSGVARDDMVDPGLVARPDQPAIAIPTDRVRVPHRLPRRRRPDGTSSRSGSSPATTT